MPPVAPSYRGGSSSPAVAALQVLAAALCFSTTGTAQALGPAGVPPVAVGAGRLLVGAGGLILVLVLSERVAPSAAGPSPRAAPGPGTLRRLRDLAGRRECWLGGTAVATYQACFFLAVRSTGVAVGTLVALGSAPVATGLLAALAGQGRPGRRWVVATALAAVGLAVLVLGRSSVSGVSPGGVALALVAGASYALYAVPGKRLLDEGVTPAAAMTAMFGIGAALLLPALVLLPSGGLATARGLVLVAWLGLVPTTLGYVLFGSGLRSLPAAQVSTLTLAEPLAAAALGVGLLHEALTAASAAGAALLLAGIAVLAVQPSWPRRDTRRAVALRPVQE